MGRERSWGAGVLSHFPRGQFLRYLLVGVWNTAFGYSTFAGLTWLLSHPYPKHGYILASVLSSLVNITVSFLGYKWFIFKTEGNYLREWLKSLMVYSGGIALSTALLPGLVYLVQHATHLDRRAPYLAGALMSGLTVIYSFIGNRKFTFKTKAPVALP